jgi:hypothetical protein
MQVHIDVLSSAAKFAIKTEIAPGVQGEDVAGVQGCGVSTPKAALVAAATCGLDGVLHMPNGMMLVIGIWSITVAAGCFAVCTWLAGSTANVDGALPKEQARFAPFTTLIAILPPKIRCEDYVVLPGPVQPLPSCGEEMLKRDKSRSFWKNIRTASETKKLLVVIVLAGPNPPSQMNQKSFCFFFFRKSRPYFISRCRRPEWTEQPS